MQKRWNENTVNIPDLPPSSKVLPYFLNVFFSYLTLAPVELLSLLYNSYITITSKKMNMIIQHYLTPSWYLNCPNNFCPKNVLFLKPGFWNSEVFVLSWILHVYVSLPVWTFRHITEVSFANISCLINTSDEIRHEFSCLINTSVYKVVWKIMHFKIISLSKANSK